MSRACMLIRRNVVARWDAFRDGLTANRFDVKYGHFDPRPDDVLVIWNRMSRDEKIARRFEQIGACIIVTENGWIGCDGNTKLYACTSRFHNGAGSWPVDQGDRWSSFGIPVRPWRSDGSHLLVLPQRGFGSPGVRMPSDWVTRVCGQLKSVTRRDIRIRYHPGRIKSEPDFGNCFATVTWGSGAAVKGIVAGVPCFYDMPDWIAAGAATKGVTAGIEQPYLGSRQTMLHRLAWAQWSLDEIGSGVPFRRLIDQHMNRAT